MLKLILILTSAILMIIAMAYPGAQPMQDGISHTFAIVIGTLLHQLAGGKDGDS